MFKSQYSLEGETLLEELPDDAFKQSKIDRFVRAPLYYAIDLPLAAGSQVLRMILGEAGSEIDDQRRIYLERRDLTARARRNAFYERHDLDPDEVNRGARITKARQELEDIVIHQPVKRAQKDK